MTSGLLRAVFLGALQGATEFLPVSSSGHLIIVPELLGWPPASLTFDVAVHWATALAVILYFRTDWARMIAGSWRAARQRTLRGNDDARLLALLMLGTVPAVMAGALLQDALENAIAFDPHNLARLASLLLLVTGGMLALSDRVGSRERAAADLRWPGALTIGLAQAVAILPGISRSGATIAAGLGVGLRRTEAARFSFLLATPVIIGAGTLQLSELAASGTSSEEVLLLAAGFFSALVVGYAAIAWLLSYLRRAPLTIFVVYTWIVGVLALWLLR